jgi:hypothetical protein
MAGGYTHTLAAPETGRKRKQVCHSTQLNLGKGIMSWLYRNRQEVAVIVLTLCILGVLSFIATIG